MSGARKAITHVDIHARRTRQLMAVMEPGVRYRAGDLAQRTGWSLQTANVVVRRALTGGDVNEEGLRDKRRFWRAPADERPVHAPARLEKS